MMRRKKLLFVVLPIFLILSIVSVTMLLQSSQTVKAENLLDDIKPKPIYAGLLSEEYIGAVSDFSIELFKKSIKDGKNSLVSPLSVYFALGMTANGADGETLAEFKRLLGKDRLSMEELNKNNYSLMKSLTDNKTNRLTIANSIWYRENQGLTVSKEFLQTDGDYYKADAYMADFNDKRTVKDINNWVKKNTGGQIDSIVDGIDTNTMLYLFNTLYFEAEWETKYYKEAVRENKFHCSDGEDIETKFMYGSEYSYLSSDNCQGFVKNYAGDKFGFAALLPNQNISMDDFIESLTGEAFQALFKNASNETVQTAIPKFTTEYDCSLNNSLSSIGLTEAFDEDNANFTSMSNKDLYIADVRHKTFICVNEKGTKAGAVTKMEMIAKSAMIKPPKEVILDRPFVYAIIDNQTSLPVFIGVMENPKA